MCCFQYCHSLLQWCWFLDLCQFLLAWCFSSHYFMKSFRRFYIITMRNMFHWKCSSNLTSFKLYTSESFTFPPYFEFVSFWKIKLFYFQLLEHLVYCNVMRFLHDYFSFYIRTHLRKYKFRSSGTREGTTALKLFEQSLLLE